MERRGVLTLTLKVATQAVEQFRSKLRFDTPLRGNAKHKIQGVYHDKYTEKFHISSQPVTDRLITDFWPLAYS